MSIPKHDHGALRSLGLSNSTIEKLLDAGSPAPAPAYKKIVMFVTQSGSGAPTMRIVENTTGEVPVWSRSGVGFYNLHFNVLDLGFSGDTVGILVMDHLTYRITGEQASSQNINFRCMRHSDNTATDDGFQTRLIEIRIYN